MFGKKPWDKAKEFLNNPTIPRFYYKGLALDDSEFISLKELIELEKKEVYAKLLKLRDISNSMISKDDYVIGVNYDEQDGPKLKILLSENASREYNITQYTRLNGYNKTAPSYSINEEILNYLLENKNLTSKLDLMLLKVYFDELTAFKEAIESGIFYHDYSLTDATGEIVISVEHNGYHVEEIKDSIEIPGPFGKVIASRQYNGGYNMDYVYRSSTEESDYSTNIEGCGNIKDAHNILYLHKKLLPPVIQKKIN